MIRNGGGGSCDADGESNGVGCRSSGDGDESIGEEGSEGGREPGLGRMEKELSRRRYFFSFCHSAWRVKGIIPSTLHPAMLRSLVNTMSHAGLKHFMSKGLEVSLVTVLVDFMEHLSRVLAPISL